MRAAQAEAPGWYSRNSFTRRGDFFVSTPLEFGRPLVEPAFTITLLVIFLASAVTNLIHAPGRVRNAATLTVVGIMSAYNALALWDLIVFLVFPDANRAEIEAPRLLASSISIWLTNVLTFALLYWAIDGGGPERRLRDPAGPRDLRFRQACEDPAIRNTSSWHSSRLRPSARPIPHRSRRECA